ncbi:MAG: transposase [Chloroflexi bacterium]|nr:transposase [Chloroflexota bacterium]
MITPDGTREWVPVRDYAARLTAADFAEALWPQEHGDKVVYAHLVQTWVRKLGPCQVLIVKPSPDAGPEQTRYWVTSRRDDTLEQVIGHAAQRWTIETLFADFKELLGSDQYQIRSAPGIVRFWALGLCLYQFLDEVRVTHQRQTGVRLTLGQVRQQIRETHATQLLDWICDQIEHGASRDDIRLALQPAMRL